MLKIIIVDDEMLIREGLAKIIGKESPCFQVVGQFPDGEDMLRHLPGLEVDVVITDIRMPVIDGLELIKKLKGDPPPYPFHPHERIYGIRICQGSHPGIRRRLPAQADQQGTAV
ncbi:response regulator [Paenibacillus sp. JTLBN-2024]